MEELRNKKGLNTDKVWYEAFDAAAEQKVRYIRRMRENDEQLNKSPRIFLSTIHGVKGGECDNVVLLTDLANKTWEELYVNPDNECRAFYVGVTRTKDNLHIVRGKTRKEFLFV